MAKSQGKPDRTVVRNNGCMASAFEGSYRHNERLNEYYGNGDICTERADLNIHFKQFLSPDGTPETYQQSWERMKSEGVFSDKGRKPTSRSFDEMILDVNTDFFERNGGYEYAKKFYEEAYRFACQEAGGEQFVISAVLHADERNKELSERLGYDVYHYHLHVIYVPVVEKVDYYRRKKGEPEDAPLREKSRFMQMSHAKKWPGRMWVERDGKQVQVNAYSLLQDRYFEHMRAAGFEGFERGERGSTAEHLDVLDYKIQQDTKRLETLDRQVEKREAKIEKLDEKLTLKTNAKATLDEINAMGKPALLGGMNFSDDEAKRLKSLARKSVGIDKSIEKHSAEYRAKITSLESQIRELNGQIIDWRRSYQTVSQERDTYKHNYDRLWAEVKPFIDVIRKFPQMLLDFIRERLPQHHNKSQEER